MGVQTEPIKSAKLPYMQNCEVILAFWQTCSLLLSNEDFIGASFTYIKFSPSEKYIRYKKAKENILYT